MSRPQGPLPSVGEKICAIGWRGIPACSRAWPAPIASLVVVDQLLDSLVQRRGPALVIGAPGAGKTALSRRLAHRLDGLAFTATVPGPVLSEADFIDHILAGFGIQPAQVASNEGDSGLAREQPSQALRRFLAGLPQIDAPAVVIVDDAHSLPAEVLALIARLAAIEAVWWPLLQFVLVGRPDLCARLRAPELEAFERRMFTRIEVGPAPRKAQDPPIPGPRRGVSLAAAVGVVLLGSVVGAGLTALAVGRAGF